MNLKCYEYDCFHLLVSFKEKRRKEKCKKIRCFAETQKKIQFNNDKQKDLKVCLENVIVLKHVIDNVNGCCVLLVYVKDRS